jgi:hypothetical protein
MKVGKKPTMHLAICCESVLSLDMHCRYTDLIKVNFVLVFIFLAANKEVILPKSKLLMTVLMSRLYCG